MAVVQGIMERVHHPVYDSVTVPPGQQLGDVERTGILKFFVNVQAKTKLETNLQAASLLPHYNTFEARALRVVISDQPPEFEDPNDPDESEDVEITGLPVVAVNGAGAESHVLDNGTLLAPGTALPAGRTVVTADVVMTLSHAFQLLTDARNTEDGYVEMDVDEPGVTLQNAAVPAATIALTGAGVLLHKEDLEIGIEEIEPEARRPPIEQLRLNDGAGTLIGKFIYNTVTTFYVGEKVMIQMPTWFFPAGAGPSSDTVKHVTHGEPTPLATFRFAEPIYIDRQQPFRVEIEVPDSAALRDLKRIYGPLKIWVVLDGFMQRSVQ